MSHTVLLKACSVKERLRSWVSYCMVSHTLVQGRPLGERVEQLLQTAAHGVARVARFCSDRVGERYVRMSLYLIRSSEGIFTDIGLPSRDLAEAPQDPLAEQS